MLGILTRNVLLKSSASGQSVSQCMEFDTLTYEWKDNVSNTQSQHESVTYSATYGLHICD